MTILDEIAAFARERVRQAKKECPAGQLSEKARSLPKGDFPFEKALSREGLSFICECKKASPSKGVIAEDFPYLKIALDYEQAGADALSVLTEPKWFLGKDAYLQEIVKAVRIPALRKDFTVDPYMIYEAKCLGASAVLLIVSILSREELEQYLKLCDELGLSALTECHDEAEVETALSAGARIVGVNNRNLKDFSVDTGLSARLRRQIPKDVIFVSESGVRNADDVALLREIGADAVLIGETLMRAADKTAAMHKLRGLQ
ncbi:MAG: indole-3-glycerol phosphate synthase TrpC [Lachnospiraceae bacterium]|nr:indole-3-glycerol phosphate synthase TrpC [Lachnospiraceae bacterium]